MMSQLADIFAPQSELHIPSSVQGLGGNFKQSVTQEDVELWEKQCELVLKFVLKLLESWTGVIALCSNGVLEPLVNALRIPQAEIHHRIIDTIFTALHANVLNKSKNPFAPAPQPPQEPAVVRALTIDMPPPLERHHNLIDNQIAVLLMGLINAGLLEVLVEIAKSPTPPPFPDTMRRIDPLSSSGAKQDEELPLATKAAVLVGEIHFLSNKLLHPSQCVELQLLPTLVGAASCFWRRPEPSVPCKQRHC